jgi:hypothetical protein
MNVPPFYRILLPLSSAAASQPLLHGETPRIIFRIPKNAGKKVDSGILCVDTVEAKLLQPEQRM